jgi:hypothetical protein
LTPENLQRKGKQDRLPTGSGTVTAASRFGLVKVFKNCLNCKKIQVV